MIEDSVTKGSPHQSPQGVKGAGLALRATVSLSKVGGRPSPQVVHTRWTNTITAVATSPSLGVGGQASCRRSSLGTGPMVATREAISCCQTAAMQGQRVKMWKVPFCIRLTNLKFKTFYTINMDNCYFNQKTGNKPMKTQIFKK